MIISPKRPIVCMITSGRCTDDDIANGSRRLTAAVETAAEKGITLLQIREKRLSGRNLYMLAAGLKDRLSETDIKIFVNDRADIAMAADCHGVQLTSTSLSPAAIRKAFGEHLEIGISAHTLDDVHAASNANADLVLFAPVFATPGKSAAGIDLLKKACLVDPNMPVLALGGVDSVRISEVLDAGAAGYAAIRMFDDETHEL